MLMLTFVSMTFASHPDAALSVLRVTKRQHDIRESP